MIGGIGPGAVLLLGAAILCAGSAPPPAKGPISGLVTMGALRFVDAPPALPDNRLRELRAHPGLYAGAVINLTWAQIEPARGRFDFAAVRAGLAAIAAYNTGHQGARVAGKLRIFGGPDAPGWAKSIGGAPLTLVERRRPQTVGRVWSAEYRAAWRDLQGALAAAFDADPRVAEVGVSSCGISTDEPFVIPLGPDNLPVLLRAGYSNQAMEACLAAASDDYAPWRQVAIDFPFNPWRRVIAGRLQPAPEVAVRVMRAFRARLGRRAVVSNHGLVPVPPANARIVLNAMRALGAPIAVQTRSPRVDWPATFGEVRALGATEFEIWNTGAAGGLAAVSAAELRRWGDQISPAR